jgi:hypothetical protein
MSTTSAISGSYSRFRNGICTVVNFREFYAIDSSTHWVVYYDSCDGQVPTRGNLWTMPQASDVSAGLEPNGAPVVYSISTADQAVWVNNTWSEQLEGGSQGYCMASAISGTRHGEVYAINYYSCAVWVHPWNGSWQCLGYPGGKRAWQISAGTDGGRDQVFAINSDGAIYVYKSTGGAGWQLVDNTAVFTKLSASQDDNVYAVDANGSLHRESEWRGYLGLNGPWIDFWRGAKMPALGISLYHDLSVGTDVNGHDVVYAIDQFQGLVYYDATGSATLRDINIKAVDAADGGLFYDVSDLYPNSTTGTPWMFDPNTGWTQLDSQGAIF